MAISTRTGQIQLIIQDNKPLHKRRALNLIESTKIKDRMMGYALLTTCFYYCSYDTQNYIRKKWKEETNLKKMKKSFLNHCSKIFLQHY